MDRQKWRKRRRFQRITVSGRTDHQNGVPTTPQAGERDPEGAVKAGEPRLVSLPGIDRELLSEGKLDEGLVPTAPEQEQGENATEDGVEEGS